MASARSDPSRSARPAILLSANSGWNILNFRSGLLEALARGGYRPIVAAPADAHLRALARRGVETIPLPMSRAGMNPFADAVLVGRYLALLRRLRPLAYLGFTIKPNVYGGLAARLAAVPAVHNVSGLGTMFLGRPLLASLALRLYRAAFAKSDVIFFQNRDDLNLFVERGAVQPNQARLLPGSGIDLKRFAPADSPGGASPSFLFIGRLLRDKGVREFIEAARVVKAIVPGARFQLLGGLDPANRSAIGAEELRGWVGEGVVEHLGEADDVRPWIAAATAVVLPSYREGMPRALLEAAAMGRPLVAADVPGCREIVDHGVNGLLCEVRSAASLASALVQLANMPVTDLRAMGRAARDKVERHFSEELVVGAYLDVLAEIRRRVER